MILQKGNLLVRSCVPIESSNRDVRSSWTTSRILSVG
nr:MAG TPA: hypothetical protein [Caudoviricetes sp.]